MNNQNAMKKPLATCDRIIADNYEHVFLMAEDNPADEVFVKEMLNQAFGDSYRIVCVDRFSKIAEALLSDKFEILILDLGLPDRSGVENVSELGQRFPDLPIVILTGQDDLNVAVNALQSGAQDYLSKNRITPEMLSRSLHYAKERKKIEQQLRCALEDSAYRNMLLEMQTKQDYLTGLPNRSYLQEVGSTSLHRALHSNKEVAMLFFDLNGFKKINDSYGHLMGDSILKQLAKRLKKEVRGSDLLVRLGGDEFVILTDLLDSRDDVIPILNRLSHVFDLPFKIESSQIILSTSIGVAYFPESESLDLLLKNSDFAMYQAKQDLEKNTCFFTESMLEQFSLVHRIEQNLGSAANNGEFAVVFQPIIASSNEQQSLGISVEALVRWHSPELGQIAPDDFISLAERGPVINDITRLVIKQSAELLSVFSQKKIPLKIITINVCASQLENPHFCNLFLGWLEESELPAHKVCIELTERQIVSKAQACQQQFSLLRQKGITFALDDFGTGYSSITHLLSLDIDVLKLDRFLIDNIDTNSRHFALVAGILEMARHLGMRVVAEGIERTQEYDLMKKFGIYGLQGYFIAKPMSMDELLKWYSSQKFVNTTKTK